MHGVGGKNCKKARARRASSDFLKRPQFEAVHDNVHPLISYSLPINNL